MADPPSPDYQTLKKALQQLTTAPRKPSATKRLRELLPEIEASQAAGASLEEIRLALADKGLDLSWKAFESALYRARQHRAKGQGAPTPAPAAGPPQTKPKTANWEIPETKRFKHDPSADDDVFK